MQRRINVDITSWHLCHVASTSVQRDGDNITSHQRRCNVMALHRRWFDVALATYVVSYCFTYLWSLINSLTSLQLSDMSTWLNWCFSIFFLRLKGRNCKSQYTRVWFLCSVCHLIVLIICVYFLWKHLKQFPNNDKADINVWLYIWNDYFQNLLSSNGSNSKYEKL